MPGPAVRSSSRREPGFHGQERLGGQKGYMGFERLGNPKYFRGDCFGRPLVSNSQQTRGIIGVLQVQDFEREEEGKELHIRIRAVPAPGPQTLLLSMVLVMGMTPSSCFQYPVLPPTQRLQSVKKSAQSLALNLLCTSILSVWEVIYHSIYGVLWHPAPCWVMGTRGWTELSHVEVSTDNDLWRWTDSIRCARERPSRRG